MTHPADWWSVAGLRHAFVAPSFRSLCGDVRWTAAVVRGEVEPLCSACLALVDSGPATGRALVAAALAAARIDDSRLVSAAAGAPPSPGGRRLREPAA